MSKHAKNGVQHCWRQGFSQESQLFPFPISRQHRRNSSKRQHSNQESPSNGMVKRCPLKVSK